MGRQSGGASVTISALAKLQVAPARSLPNRVALLGDSRAASVALDGAKRILAGMSPFNWANALLGQRFTIAAMLGVSGERTDQVAGRIGAATASGAGLLYLIGGLNDIAQQLPTAATSGATAAANLIAMAQAARAAGMIVVIEAEVGAGNLSAAQVAQVQELNARLFAFAAATPGVFVHDARPVVLDPNAVEGSLAYRTGYSYDGNHPNTRGSQAWGRSLATLLGALASPRIVPLPASRADAPANGRWQFVKNALFVDDSGGTVGANCTGTVPAWWESRASSGTTLTTAVATNAQALGNRVSLAATFGAAGQSASLLQVTTDPQPGETVQAFAEVSITDATALAGVYLLLEQYTGAGGTTIASGSLRAVSGAGHSGPVAGDRLVLATPPYTLAANVGAGPYTVVTVRGEAIGAGAAGFAVDRVGLVRVV